MNTETSKNEKGLLEQQLKDKQKQVNDLKSNLEQEQQKTKDEKKKCEDLKVETVKAGKNPDNLEESPQTFKQCLKIASFDEQINKTQDNLSKAEQELKMIESQLAKFQTADNSQNNLLNLTVWLVGGIASLAVLSGLGWLAYSIFTNANKVREATNHGFKMANRNNQELARRIQQLEQIAKLQGNQFNQIQTALQSLQRQNSEIARTKSEDLTDEII